MNICLPWLAFRKNHNLCNWMLSSTLQLRITPLQQALSSFPSRAPLYLTGWWHNRTHQIKLWTSRTTHFRAATGRDVWDPHKLVSNKIIHPPTPPPTATQEATPAAGPDWRGNIWILLSQTPDFISLRGASPVIASHRSRTMNCLSSSVKILTSTIVNWLSGRFLHTQQHMWTNSCRPP